MYSWALFVSSFFARIGSISSFTAVIIFRNIVLKNNVVLTLLLLVPVLNFSVPARLGFYIKDVLGVSLWLAVAHLGRIQRHNMPFNRLLFIILTVWLFIAQDGYSKEVLFLISALPLSYVLNAHRNSVWNTVSSAFLIIIYLLLDSMTMSISLIIALSIRNRILFGLMVVSVFYLLFYTSLNDYLYHYILESRFAPAIDVIKEFSWQSHLFGVGSGFEIEIPWFKSGLWQHSRTTSPAVDSLLLTFYLKYGLLGVLLYVYPLSIIFKNRHQRKLLWFLVPASCFNAVSYQLFFPVLIYYYGTHRG